MMDKATVLPETVWLAMLCLIDAANTVYLVSSGIAVEANPMLSWSFRYGPGAFLLLKIATFMSPLAILEMLRPRVGGLIQTSLRLGIAGYIAVYAIGSLALHTVR